MDKNWEVRKVKNMIVASLAKDLGVSKIIAHLLVLRGIKTFNEAKLFFRPELSHLHNPFLMKGMKEAVTRIEIAIKKNQNILVYGDYDVDGTTSVAMMYLFLKKYNKNVEYYIPSREDEGYGVSLKGIDYASKKNFSLIIALDCGIRAVEQINYANKKGVDFIICDHHNPSDKIPNAVAVLNPKQFRCNYPYKDLSGCGVGFKLIQAYSLNNNIPFDEVIEYLDLVAVSIGADIVPMTGENRVLAFYGLKKINSKPRVGLQVLMNAASNKKEYSMSDMIFGIAPRINAAGRIDHAKKAVEILVEADYENAKSLAFVIEENNRIRKELDQSITREAIQMVDDNKKSIVVFSEKWHKGVLGIVASRLIEVYYKPTVVLAEKDGMLIGSARSVHEFDLYQALSECSYLCDKFGGHKYAAGLSIKKENIQAFIDAFEIAVSKKITNDQTIPKIEVDMEININHINEKLFRIIKQFSPFGPLNLLPVFISKGVRDSGFSRNIGNESQHLQVSLQSKKQNIKGIGFGMGDFLENIQRDKFFDICYSIQENEWKGNKTLQLLLRDIKSPV